MKIRALTSFCGSLCMAKGEIRECSDGAVFADLLDAGYIETVGAKTDEAGEEADVAKEKPDVSAGEDDPAEKTDEAGGDRKTSVKSGRKRASGEKGADSGEGK